MSWSASTSFELSPALDVAEAVGSVQVFGNEQALDERDEQVAAAKDAAVVLIENGAVGWSGKVVVSLSGHANPHHAKQSGYTNDWVTVGVSLVYD